MPPATGNYENVDNNVESDENGGGDGAQQQQEKNKTKKQKQKEQKKGKKIVSPTFLSMLQRQVAAEIFSIVKNQFSVSDEILSNVDQVHVQMPLQQQQQQHKKMKTGDLFCSVAMQIFGQLKKLGQSSSAPPPPPLLNNLKSPGQLAQAIVDELLNRKKGDSSSGNSSTVISSHMASIEASNNGFINFYLNENSKKELECQLTREKQEQVQQDGSKVEKANRLRSREESSSSSSSSASSSSSSSSQFDTTMNDGNNDDVDDSRIEQKESKKPKKEAAHRLELSLHPSSFDQEAFELYRKYQVAVHKDQYDEVTEKSYTGFLIDSPMKMERVGVECPSFEMVDEIPGLEGLASMTFSGFHGYGSYHVHYRLDGKLFMVGVVDLLPSCLSSVYLFYDPDMMFLKPGVYSSLAEILYVKLLSKKLPNFHYYYMGYYIHTCKKMKYKAGYKPSDLLCPVTYTWVPISECIDRVKMDNDHEKVKPEERKLRLAPESVPAEVIDTSNLDDVLCVIERSLATVQTVRRCGIVIPQSERTKIATYKQMVGPVLCTQIARILNLNEEGDEEEEGDNEEEENN